MPKYFFKFESCEYSASEIPLFLLSVGGYRASPQSQDEARFGVVRRLGLPTSSKSVTRPRALKGTSKMAKRPLSFPERRPLPARNLCFRPGHRLLRAPVLSFPSGPRRQERHPLRLGRHHRRSRILQPRAVRTRRGAPQEGAEGGPVARGGGHASWQGLRVAEPG